MHVRFEKDLFAQPKSYLVACNNKRLLGLNPKYLEIINNIEIIYYCK